MKSKINRDSWENQTSDCIIIKESNDFMVGVRGRKLRGDPGETESGGHGVFLFFFPTPNCSGNRDIKTGKGKSCQNNSGKASDTKCTLTGFSYREIQDLSIKTSIRTKEG